MLPSAANSDGNGTDTRLDEEFKYDSTMRRISALGWSTDLRHLPEMNFVQLYDYVVVSTRKYQHIVLKGTNYKKLLPSSSSKEMLKSWNAKPTNDSKRFVRANVLPSMKKTPYRVVIELCSARCLHLSRWTWIRFFQERCTTKPEPLTCTSRLSTVFLKLRLE